MSGGGDNLTDRIAEPWSVSSHSLFFFEPTLSTCLSTASASNDGVLGLDCDSRRDVGPTKTIRGVYMTQLNRLERLAALSALRERSF